MLFINKYIYLFSEEKSLATQTFLWRMWTWEGGGGSGEDGRAGIRERSRKLELERRWRRCKGGQWLSSCAQADGVEREEKEQLRSDLDGWLWKTEYFSQLCPLLYLHCRLKNEKVKTRSNALAKIWKENLRAIPVQIMINCDNDNDAYGDNDDYRNNDDNDDDNYEWVFRCWRLPSLEVRKPPPRTSSHRFGATVGHTMIMIMMIMIIMMPQCATRGWGVFFFLSSEKFISDKISEFQLPTQLQN